MAQPLNIAVNLSPMIDAQKLNLILANLKQSLGKFGEDIKFIDAEKLNRELAKIDAEAAKAAAELDKMDQNVKKAAKSGDAFGKAFKFNMITQAVNTTANALGQVLAVGNEYEATLAAVGAVTGQTGEGLNKLGTAARELGKEFGTSASSNLKSFQGILSKFGPQVADNAEALKSMGQTVNTLSAASGDSADVSMAALTDTMLQLGLVTGDAAKDAETMTKVADALAASAKVGAAEIPQVAQSILQTGVAAKGAKLSLEQTTAAIQVLAVGGKTGSEAGVALRNVLGLLQKQSGPGAAALQKMGLSVEQLGETLTTQGLDAALKLLKGGLDQAGSAAERNAIMMTLFGTENSAAAGILLDNLGLFGDFEKGIGNAVQAGAQGADGAVAQAAARLGTAEAIAGRLKAQVEDVFIAIQSGIGSGLSGLLTATAQVAPSISALTGFKEIFPESATKSMTKFAKKIVVTLIPSLATTASMAGTTGFSFTAMWTAVTGPVGLAIAAIVAIGAALVLAYNKVEGFRNVIDGAIDALVEIYDIVSPIFGKVADLLVSVGGIVFQAIVLPLTTAWDVSMVIGEAIAGWIGKLGAVVGLTDGTGSKFEVLRSIVDKVVLAFDIMKATLDGISAGVGAFVDATTGSLSKLLGGDFVGAATQFFGAGDAAAAAYKEGFTDSMRDAQIENTISKLTEGVEASIDVQTKIDSAASLDTLTADLTKIQGEMGELEVRVKNGTATKDEIAKLESLKEQAQKTAAEIATVAPGAVNSVKNVVDASGNIVKVYDVNIAKAREFKNEALKTFGAEASKNAESYSKRLGNLSTLYDQQRKDLDEIKKAAEAAANSGDPERAKQLTEEYKEQKKKVDETGAALEKAFTEGGKAGLLTEDAFKKIAKAQGITVEEAKKQGLAKALAEADKAGGATEASVEKIAKQFGYTKEEAMKLLAQQREQSKQAEQTAQKVKDIGEAFEENAKKAKDGFSDTASDAAGLQYEVNQLEARARKGRLTQAERERLVAAKKELADYKKQLADRNNEAVAYEKAKEQVLAPFEKKDKKTNTKSDLELLKEILGNTSERLSLENDAADTEQERQIIAEKRKKTASDELVQEERRLKALEEQLALLKTRGLIGDDGQIVATYKFKKDSDEKEEAENIVKKLNIELAKQRNKLEKLNIEVDADVAEFAKKRREGEIETLRDLVERGLAEPAELVSVITSEIDALNEKILTADAETRLTLLKDRAKFENELEKLAKSRVTKELEALKEKQTKEAEEYKKSQEDYRRHGESLVKVASDSAELRLSLQRDAALEALEKQKQDELITEEEYNARKEEAESRYQAERMLSEQRAAGQRLFIQEELAKRELELKKKQLEEQLAAAKKEEESTKATLESRLRLAEALRDVGAQEQIKKALAVDAGESTKKLQEELGKVTDSIAEKGTTLEKVGETLKDGLNSSIESLFSGDMDAAKDNMKSTLALVAGFLEKLASAAVIEIVLGSTIFKSIAAAAGFLAPVVLLGAQQLVSAGVRQLLNPILSSILSFPTGGVFESPTLAVVGDGSRLGGSNIEYLLRHDQMKALINEVTNVRDNQVVRAIHTLGSIIQSAFGGFVIRGEDIYAASNRTSARVNKRARTLTTIS